MKMEIRILLFSAMLVSILSCDGNKTEEYQATQEKQQVQQQIPKSAAPEQNGNDEHRSIPDDKWDQAKKETEKALQQSKEAGKAIWEASKESSSELWSDSKEKSDEIWDDVKEKSNDLWDVIKEKSNETLEKLFNNTPEPEEDKTVSKEPIQI